MSKIYKLIEEQVNILLRFLLEDEKTGQVHYPAWLPGGKYIKPVVQLLTILVFLAVVLIFGVYLWNYGLQPAFPGIVARLDPMNPSQASNAYTQLVLTLIALMMFT